MSIWSTSIIQISRPDDSDVVYAPNDYHSNMAIQEITVAELQEILPNIVLIDVREIDEYVSGHVPGAISIPLSTVQDNIEPFLAHKPTYVICLGGGRSYRACEFAEQHGAECINIAGGTGAWIQSGFDVVLGELPNS
jgi:rhodanese-related sulfurtransferase